ncbi:nuclear transport factor 2 family protein [Pigmentiphaga soli]|uniref:Nuclear transport factor 2 family protein n=1 Tax=Pigmentiphaga soli TaxID=1007095 RepID=A0ABP8H1E7_9BURK
MNDPDPYSPARIADRMAIQDTMYRWCRAVDRLDFDGIRSVFHPDAIDRHGPFEGSVDGLVEWIRERHRAIPFSMHQISNILIEFAGPDLALVETYVRTVQRYPAEAKAALAQLSGGAQGRDGLGADLFTCSRYVDRFERRDGEWRIARRTLVQDWKQIVDVPADAPRPREGWLVGRRDRQDPLYLERAELGL